MAKCDCGAETPRLHVHVESPDGKLLPQPYSTCPSCRPAEFPADEPFTADNRILPEHVAFPDKYRKDSEGVFHQTDEAKQDDLDRIMADGPTAKAEKARAASRRTEPMSPVEIAAAEAWGRAILAPKIREAELDHRLREGEPISDLLQ